MQTTLLLSSNSRSTAGVLLLTLVAVEYGGWFLSAAGKGSTSPNRFIVLLYLGVVSLTIDVVSLGIGLLTA
jgi:hypothetical protein